MRCLPIVLALCAIGHIHADQPSRPNVLFIVADDLRNELGCYGSIARTPNIDRLATQGTQFQHAYCQQAVCNPSRSSFLTGKRPDSLHLWNNGTHFRERNPDVITLPQHFKANGYTTRCVGKIFHNWHTAVRGDRGSWSADEFLHYANHGDDVPMAKDDLPANLAGLSKWNYGNTTITECRDLPDEAYYDGRVAAEARKVLATLKDQEFFLAVGFWKPHAPFNAPKKYWDLYDRAKLPQWRAERPRNAVELAFHDSREVLGIPPKGNVPTPEQSAEMRHGYLANVSYMDAQVGKVIAALDELGLRKKTIVVFVSDHGYHLGEHTLWGKTSCFEYDARVPLIISSPGVKAARTDSLAELVDLFPTLVDLCGLRAPAGLDGAGLGPILKRPTQTVKSAAFTQHPRPAYFDRTETKTPTSMGYSVRTPTHRYTEWRAWTDGKLLGAELYNHDGDSFELSNLIDDPLEQSARKSAREALHRQFSPDVAPSKR